MHLNLHILREDLHHYDLQGSLSVSPTTLNLAYPVSCRSMPAHPSSNVLYVIDAEDLPNKAVSGARISLICLGRPSSAWIESAHDVLWTEVSLHIEDMISELSALFWRYSEWDLQLHRAVEERLPFDYLAEVSQPFFPNPFAALTSSYRLLFTAYPEVENPSEEYLQYKVSTAPSPAGFMSSDYVSAIATDSQHARVQASSLPVMYNGEAFGYKTLVYNIFIEDVHCGYFTSDGIIRGHTLREHALAKHLGDAIGRMLEREDSYLLTHPDTIRRTLGHLIEHDKVVPDAVISDTLAYFGWKEGETLVSATVTLQGDGNQTTALPPLAMSIARSTANDCYYIAGQSIVFVFNLSRLNEPYTVFAESLEKLLDGLRLVGGLSSSFGDLRMLYYHHCQARFAMTARQSGKTLCTFAECMTDFIVEKLKEGTVADIYLSDGLVKLLRHDSKRGTDYARLLEVHLRNERNIAKTVRQMHMHRNTFNYRYARIAEILDMDLENADVRFNLLVAFQMLELRERSR